MSRSVYRWIGCPAAILMALTILLFPDVVTPAPDSRTCDDRMNHPVCVREGDAAADFNLRGFDNSLVRLSELKGTPVLIDFFSVDCSACRQMLPVITEFANRNGDKVRVILIAIPEPGDRGNVRLKEYFKRNPVPFTLLLDLTGYSTSAWVPVQDGEAVIPYLFLIDGNGIVRGVAGGIHKSVEAALPAISSVIAR